VARNFNNDDSYWPVKLAHISFITEEEKFVIYPKDLGTDIDDYLFERIEHRIRKDLETMGILCQTILSS